MSRTHRRELSVVRLTQPLPPLPLPLDDIPPPPPKETQLPPYRDVDEAQSSTPETQPPPGYEPMYDYLRTHRASNPPQYNSSSPIVPTASEAPTFIVQESYRDEPFIVTIDPPPPSYDDVYNQHQEQMQRLIREFDDNGDASERSEEIFKWFMSMVLIILTVAAVGTAFNWGRCENVSYC